MEKLKPCPFCGDEAEKRFSMAWLISCSGCAVTMGRAGSEQAVIEKWNRRAGEAGDGNM